MRLSLLIASIASTSIATVATDAQAQFVGSFFSGPTDADGSSPFWNPAAMHEAPTGRVDLGLTATHIGGDFTAAEDQSQSKLSVNKAQPTFGIVLPAITGKFRFGVTVGVPFGGGAAWSRDEAASRYTRYHVADGTQYIAVATPAVSYRVHSKISIGGGLHVAQAKLKADLDTDMGSRLNASVNGASGSSGSAPFRSFDGGLAAPTEVRSSGFGLGGSLAVFARPHQTVSIGASLHSPINVESRGTVSVVYPEEMLQVVNSVLPAAELPPLNSDAVLTLSAPLSVYTAVSWSPTPNWGLRAEYKFQNYAAIPSSTIAMLNASTPELKDTPQPRSDNNKHAAGIRVQTDSLSERFKIAARVRIENNRIPKNRTTPGNLDFTKVEFGLATDIAINSRWSLSAHVLHIAVLDSTVETSLYQPISAPELSAYNKPSPTGRYNLSADQIGLFLTMEFQ